MSIFRGRRRLLFRSYLILVGGLLLVAIVLDFGFRQLQSESERGVDRWLVSTLQLIEAGLAAVPSQERRARAAEIAEQLGVGVQLLDRDAVQVADSTNDGLTPLVDAEGNTSYLHDSDSIGSIIRLGPISAVENGLAIDLLPTLFYLSIFIVVGLWLRPLLRDINTISAGANRFAADYREPLSTEQHTTELKPLARNLDAMAARLAGVLRSQKELIAALSHEMRTPLARLRFALAVLDDRADEQLKDKLAAMNRDVEEIDDLVASMLNYARLDHPDIKMNWQDVPVDAWVRQVVAKVSGDAISVILRVDDAPDEVRMDPGLMELALSNLLVNATKYADGTVVCAVRADAGGFVLSVEDDGPGIPEEEWERVFKAFTRVDDSRNRETGGYGLGLAVVARVAELHGGDVAVDGSPDFAGARFLIRWPAKNH